MGGESTKLTAKDFYPNREAKKPSWIIIVVMFIVFFPVGIHLLQKRVLITKGRGKAAIVTYVWSVLGIILTGLVLLGGGGIVCWIFLAVFVFAGLIGMGDRMQWKEYDTLIALFMSGEWYLPIICDAIGKKQDETVTTLKEMFDDGIFAGSYVDLSDLTVEVNYDCLASMGIHAPELKTIYVPDDNYATPAYTKTVVRCKGCGANVEGIVGQTGTCEFCDSPISFV